MNGVHDMGGMHGMGPIPIEKDEPVFHEPWEGRVYAMTRAIGAWKKWTIDTGRYHIELIPAADYLRMTYYEKWFTRLVNLLVKTGLITGTEAESGKPDKGSAKRTPPLKPAGVAAMALNRNIAPAHDPAIPPRFKVGQRVRARNINPEGHTRLPRYARGKNGKIAIDHGVYVLPDSSAHGGDKRQHVYAVRFAARELWGEQASARDTVMIDLWDDHLERTR